jgi:hypothetical protein
MKTLALLALLVVLPARAEEDGWFQPPDAVDIVGQSLFTGLVLVDWCTTTSGLYHKGFSELNPLLGQHPSRTKLASGAIASIVGHAAVSYALPKPWRNIWQFAFIVVETDAVRHNVSVGAGFSLPWR